MWGVGYAGWLKFAADGGSYNLFDCSEAGEHFTDAIFSHGAHAIPSRLLAQPDSGNIVVNHTANLVGHEKDFKEAQPAVVAGALAGPAARTVEEVCPRQLRGRQAKGVQLTHRRSVGAPALRADAPHESLGQDGP